MGASFKDLVETNLLVNRILNQTCRWRDSMFWIFELGENLCDIRFILYFMHEK
jgi:hypothetical protein